MKTVSLDFTDLEIYPGYVVGRTHEGVNIDAGKHQQVLDVIHEEINGPYALIIDEVNSYSVDFSVMVSLSRDPLLKCGAIVAYRYSTLKALACAVRIIGKPVRVFTSLRSAHEWVVEYLQQQDD